MDVRVSPITGGDVMEAIDRVVAGVERFARWRRDRALREAKAAVLDEMLRNPRWVFRSTATLAGRLGDHSDDLADTRDLLRALVPAGVLGSTTSDAFWRRANWQLDEDGRPQRGADGRYRLRDGVVPGTL